jgi:hypothetical protein
MDPQEILIGISKVIESQAKVLEATSKEHSNDYGTGTRRDKIIESMQEMTQSAKGIADAYTGLLKRIGVGADGKVSIRLIRPDELEMEMKEDPDNDQIDT